MCGGISASLTLHALSRSGNETKISIAEPMTPASAALQVQSWFMVGQAWSDSRKKLPLDLTLVRTEKWRTDYVPSPF